MFFGGSIRFHKSAVFITIFLILFYLYVFRNTSKSNDLIIKYELKENYVSLKELLCGSILAAQLGGRQILDAAKRNASYLDVRLKGKTHEGLDDSVTRADYNSHCQMVFALKNVFPKLSIVSEENLNASDCFHDRKLQSINLNDGLAEIENVTEEEFVDRRDILVWIDPLDATKEFIEGLHQYVTTMVCVTIHGRPAIGVIHKPFSNETFWMWIDRGHSNQFAKVSAETSRKLSTNNASRTVLVSMSHTGDIEEKVREKFGAATKVKKAAGAGYKILEIALGNAKAYMHSTVIKKWDVCAGNAVIDGLGGKVVDFQTRPIDYSSSSEPVISDGLIVTL